MKKTIVLPGRAPLSGAAGADVVIVADEALDSLLHLQKTSKFTGASGSAANAGEVGSLSSRQSQGGAGGGGVGRTAPLVLRVPVGTLVRRKRSATLLADLTRHGQAVCVARGGRGGLGTFAKSQRRARNDPDLADVLVDMAPKEFCQGEPGEAATLELLLRVVADVGLVGLPNVGKSSLLAVLTRANPTIANYPFTTLMPNLGVLEGVESGAPVLADLPGLIQDAHKGKGLGREFLRHLRRTRAILHVVDLCQEDPFQDYLVVREELRMYNPAFVQRPHVVALNKLDLLGPDGEEWAQYVKNRILNHYSEDQEHAELVGKPPVSVIASSATSGMGTVELLDAVASILQDNHL